MCAFLKSLWCQGWDVARTSYEILALQVRDTFKPGSRTTEMDVLRPLLSASKLVIEDVGSVSAGQQESEFSLRTFLVLLDQRIEQCLATFMTSNRSIEELGRSFDQRVSSRLQQACEVVHITGSDKRVHTT
jgi:DNA replication protein DnaC